MADEESAGDDALFCDDPHEVVLVDCGPREMEVILAVGEVTGLGMWRSRTLVRRAPVVVAGGLSPSRAQSAVSVLQNAGARAEWRQEPEPGERATPAS